MQHNYARLASQSLDPGQQLVHPSLDDIFRGSFSARAGAKVSQPKSQLDMDLLSINTIRTVAIDAVQQANSGHPGAPMGLAPVVYALWQKHLRYDPADPTWPNRDRFVLSAGHASMLLYATLHLAGVKQVSHDGKVQDAPAVSMEEIKRFRQIGSKTPGHPESHLTTGVETTTGPPDKAPATAWAWPSRVSGLPRITTARASRFLISECMRCAATAT